MRNTAALIPVHDGVVTFGYLVPRDDRHEAVRAGGVSLSLYNTAETATAVLAEAEADELRAAGLSAFVSEREQQGDKAPTN